MHSWNDGVRSGESSIEQRPDTRICVVQRISDGMKEREGDGCQKKSEAVEKDSRTLSYLLPPFTVPSKTVLARPDE